MEITTSKLGLFCLAGERFPDSTVEGPPTVSSVTPAPDAADVPLDASITVTFNEAILAADLLSIEIDGATMAGATLDQTNRIITISLDELVHGVTYTITVPVNSVMDYCLNFNEAEYSWSFTTVEANNIPFAMDDYIATDESSSIDGENVLHDNGEGEDYDDEDDPLTFVSVNGDPANLGAPVSGSNGGIFTIGNDGALTFDPNGEFETLGVGASSETTVAYAIDDGHAEDSATVTVTVHGENDRPVLSGDARALKSIYEDAGNDDGSGSDGDDDVVENSNNPGTKIGDILLSAGTAEDMDGDTLGMAITGVNHENGTWQYYLDPAGWLALDGATAIDNALLLGPEELVRFVPDQNHYGDINGSIAFKAWDLSSGGPGDANVDTNTGTAFSAGTAQATLTVYGLADDYDDDNDGMPTHWEKRYGLDPLANDADLDSDGDGADNLRECEADTDPTDENSVPADRGDMNNDGVIDLNDVEAILKVLTGQVPDVEVPKGADIDGDRKTCIPEGCGILQHVIGRRQLD